MLKPLERYSTRTVPAVWALRLPAHGSLTHHSISSVTRTDFHGATREDGFPTHLLIARFGVARRPTVPAPTLS